MKFFVLIIAIPSLSLMIISHFMVKSQYKNRITFVNMPIGCLKMNYLLIIFSAVLLSLDFALSKKYQAIEGTGLISGLKFNAFAGLFTAIIFFAFSGFKVEFSLFSLILALSMTLFCMIYSIIGFKILKLGGMALYSMFLMCGGMLLPYLFGVLFLNESLTLLRIIGVIMILVAVTLFNKGKYDVKISLYLLCIAIFVLNGLVSIISKCHQINTEFTSVSTTVFVMYTGVGKFLFSMIAMLFCKRDYKTESFSLKNTAFIIIGSAFIGGASYMFQLIGAKELPATVLYPLVTGGSIIFSALSGKIFFKEKLSCAQLISIAVCFVGTLLFL